MVDRDRLSSVLSDFARTLLTNFSIQAILDHLVERIVDVLPVTGAGVTLISADLSPHHVAASDDLALRFERLQTQLGQGPCLLAYETGEPVEVPDLAADRRFSDFSAAALAANLKAVFTFPLREGGGRLGALDLYRDTPGALDPDDVAAAQTLADVAAAYLLNAQARDRLVEDRERMRASALHDSLTGLPNRALLAQRIHHAALRAQRSHSTAAVLFADLDRFKRVNDTYGHAVGDALLVAVGQRLAGLVRPGDTLARVSGDEFVILCEELAERTDVEMLARRIDEAFATPFVLDGIRLLVTASVGVAYSGPGEAITNQLLADADAAMYQAKRRGGAAHHIIDLRGATPALGPRDLHEDLRTALADGQLDLAYQPIVHTADGLVTGIEALLRWTHPVRGPIPAPAAVAAAEQSGLMIELGAWVLERGCHDLIRWRAEYPGRPLDLAVNVSVLQLMAPGYAESLGAILAATDMDPAALVLEVTEGIFIDDDERAAVVLADLRARGVRLALDDFGTGYSSMRYLQRFLVDIVKIDRSFVADIGGRPNGGVIPTAVISLAHALGLGVVAEGVETEQQRAGLVLAGCELAQGTLYAAPMSGPALASRLAAEPDHPLYLPQPPVQQDRVELPDAHGPTAEGSLVPGARRRQ